jgi:hypothetical protein
MEKLTQTQLDVAGFAPDGWEKPESSNGGNGGCVWINRSREAQGRIALADRDRPELGAFVMTVDEWTHFKGAVRAGQFD